MTGQIAIWIAALLVGVVLGWVHLGLIWLGVRQLAGPRPARGFVALAALRLLLVLGALAAWVAFLPDAAVLVAGLVGFVIVRTASIRVLSDRYGGRH